MKWETSRVDADDSRVSQHVTVLTWHLAFSRIGDDAILPGQPEERIVALAQPPDFAAKSIRLVLARHATRLLVQLGDVYLDGGMVAGADNSVGGRALPGHVQIHELSGVVLHFYSFFYLSHAHKQNNLNKLKLLNYKLPYFLGTYRSTNS